MLASQLLWPSSYPLWWALLLHLFALLSSQVTPPVISPGFFVLLLLLLHLLGENSLSLHEWVAAGSLEAPGPRQPFLLFCCCRRLLWDQPPAPLCLLAFLFDLKPSQCPTLVDGVEPKRQLWLAGRREGIAEDLIGSLIGGQKYNSGWLPREPLAYPSVEGMVGWARNPALGLLSCRSNTQQVSSLYGWDSVWVMPGREPRRQAAAE